MHTRSKGAKGAKRSGDGLGNLAAQKRLNSWKAAKAAKLRSTHNFLTWGFVGYPERKS